MEKSLLHNLKGKVVVVTGSGRGLGREYALHFGRCGAYTAVCDRNGSDVEKTVAAMKAEGLHAEGFQVDVTDEIGVKDLFTKVGCSLGPVDILVNNAGITDPGGPLWETDSTGWKRLIDINLIGQYFCIKYALMEMVSHRRGRIINIASGAGISSIPYMSAYVISKTSMIRLSEQIACEAADYGICSFAFSPGIVKTEMTNEACASEGWKKWMPWLEKKVVTGEALMPEEVAEKLILLATGVADRLSGSLISSSDDLMSLISHAESRNRDFLKLRLSNGN